MKKLSGSLLLAALAALAASPAAAHLNPLEHGSFAAGFSHPLFGLDHVLVMIAVGLWASMLGRRAVFWVPIAFVGTMVAGFFLAMAGVTLPFVEPMILASVVALGILVAMAVRMPAGAAAALVGVFALFHGFAHGGEMGAATPAQFLAGFALGTVLLHMVGIGVGLGLGRLERPSGRIGRILGSVTAVLGLGLAFGAL